MANHKLLIIFLLVLGLGSTSTLSAQDEESDDTWSESAITDDMTKDPEMNAKWRTGEYGYSSKPKSALELGVHFGHFHISGDVTNDLWSGTGVGLHLRKSLGYLLSIRVDGSYTTASGIDGRLTPRNVLRQDNSTFAEQIVDNDGNELIPANFSTYRNFKNVNYSGQVNLLFNFGNILFHKPSNDWNLYAGIGLGVTFSDVTMNYFDGDGFYDWSSIESQFPENNREKRNAIKDAFDDSYETEAENDRNVSGGLNSDGFIQPAGILTFGVSRKINKRFNVSLEHQVWLGDMDKWDGHEYRTSTDQTTDSDIMHYTSLRVGINLGNFDEVTEPLYWVNPLDATFNDIAELKQRPILDLTDADSDGVLDFLDQELGSEEGCPVDTRGVVLDSDGDGYADCKDQEPYSPPGYEVDENGVAGVPEYVTEDDVNVIVDTKVDGLRSELMESACGKWFLPMIHFDVDKYYIKPEYSSQLHSVADVMKRCPNICVAVIGHTDSRSSEEYNRVLSYNRSAAAVDYLVSNYGIERERFKLMYGGEQDPLVKDMGGVGTTSSKYFMNRRVEFRLCEPTDEDMGRPEGPNAGQGAKKSQNYDSNKSSGY